MICERHGKQLEYFCLHHGNHCCRTCKVKSHSDDDCECLHVCDVYDRLQLDMEEKIQDLVQLRDRSQRIVDGSYQRKLFYRVNNEEKHLDQFYTDMKAKFKETRLKIKAFTPEELSETLRDKLQSLFGEQLPTQLDRNDRPQDMQQQLKDATLLIRNANRLMYSLPNYIEIAVDQRFVKLLTYSDDPIVIIGRPKNRTQISTDDEMDIVYELNGDDSNRSRRKKPDSQNGPIYESGKEHLSTRLVSRKDTLDSTTADDGQGEISAHDEVLKWYNNAPVFSRAASRTKLNNTRSPNKYERQIEVAKKKRSMPPLPRTPETVRTVRERIANKNSSRSMPDNVLTNNPVKKLFLSHVKSSKFKIKERVQLDGCEDAIVLKDSVILSLGNKLQKLDRKTLKLSVEMKLTNCSTLCAIMDSHTQVAVIQLRKCITVLDTQFGLSVVYKIKIRQGYLDFCHIGNTEEGPRHPSYLFAAIYKGFPKLQVNCVDVVQAKVTHRPGRPPVFDAKAIEVMLPGGRPSLISGLGGFPDRHIVLGTGDAVICINESGKLVWKTAVPREVSGILCTKSYIYACLQDEKKVVIFNKCGFVTDEDVIPNLNIIPCKISANWDIMLLKDFKTKTWMSIIFKHGLFIV